jgi:hypothetical protein
MKDVSTKILALSVAAFFAFGCGFVENVRDVTSNTNAGASKVREAAGLKKSGIKECDELIDVLVAKGREQANTEDSWLNKAGEEIVKQKIYDSLSENNANKTPKEKAELAQNCKTWLGYLRDEPKKK